MLRVCVIGCGSAGRRHIQNLLALECRVYAMDVSQDALDRLPHGATAFPINTELAWTPEDFDALVVATPWDQHLPWVQSAVSCHVPVFVEKPLGSLDQLPQWRELVARSDLPVTQVGYQCRFHPAARWLRVGIPTPDSGGFYCDCDMATWPGRTYGPAMLECSHELDLALSCGAPVNVSGVVRLTASAWDFYLGEDARWLISGDARAPDYRRHWTVAHGLAVDATVRFMAPDELGEQMYRDELAHFLDCVRTGRQTDVPLADGLRVLEVVQQAEAMAGVST